MNHDQKRLRALEKEARILGYKQRASPYKYGYGTQALSVSPRKLATESEILLAVMLAKLYSMTRTAKLMRVSVPTVRRAIRVYYYHQEER